METTKVETIYTTIKLCDDCEAQINTTWGNECYLCGKDICESCRQWIITDNEQSSSAVCPACRSKIIKLNDKVDEAKKKRLEAIKKIKIDNR